MMVEKAKSFDIEKVVASAPGIELQAPEGLIRVAGNQHVAKKVRIGRARPDGQFDIVWESPMIEPNPFPKL
jgi:urea transport system substrate-binding protein